MAASSKTTLHYDNMDVFIGIVKGTTFKFLYPKDNSETVTYYVYSDRKKKNELSYKLGNEPVWKEVSPPIQIEFNCKDFTCFKTGECWIIPDCPVTAVNID